MGKTPAEYRKEIDEADRAIIKLLKRRFAIVLKLSRLKKKIRDTGREKEVLERIKRLLKNSQITPFALGIFKNIISQSVAYQRKHGRLFKKRNFAKRQK